MDSDLQSNVPTLLVRFSTEADIELTNMDSIKRLAEKSEEAINQAMKNIQTMSSKVASSLKDIKVSERPSEIEVTFGIELDAKLGALIAEASTKASINVKLKWERNTANSSPSDNLEKPILAPNDKNDNKS